MIILFETDGSGGDAVSALFRRGYGEDHFARFRCPYPVQPFLPRSRIPYLRDAFSSAAGIATNICMDPRAVRQVFPNAELAIIARNPVSAALRSYHSFLTTFVPQYWPVRSGTPAAYRSAGQYLREVRGDNLLVRALAAVPEDEEVGPQHLTAAMDAIETFDYIVLTEEPRLTLIPLLARHPPVRHAYGEAALDFHAQLEALSRFDAMHVDQMALRDVMNLSRHDISVFARMLEMSTAEMLRPSDR